MAAPTDTAPAARLKARYLEEIRPALMSRFGYSSIMQAPKLEKITINMGVGLAKQDNKMLKAATDQLAQIAGQQPSIRRARKSIAAFKLREGMPVGVAVTLRAERSYEFLDRLITIAIPRIRDFRGLNSRSFDGRGNYSMGVKEQIIFPEIDYDAIDMVRGLDITITTSAQNDIEAFALLSALGMPFSAERRPKAFELTGIGDDTNSEAARTAEQPGPAPLQPAAPEPDAATTADVEVQQDEADDTQADAEEAPQAEAEDAPQAESEEAPQADESTDGQEPEAEEPRAEAAEEQEPTAEQGNGPEDGDAETTEKESTD
jgi:large subunit ribosomal protein L5